MSVGATRSSHSEFGTLIDGINVRCMLSRRCEISVRLNDVHMVSGAKDLVENPDNIGVAQRESMS